MARKQDRAAERLHIGAVKIRIAVQADLADDQSVVPHPIASLFFNNILISRAPQPVPAGFDGSLERERVAHALLKHHGRAPLVPLPVRVRAAQPVQRRMRRGERQRQVVAAVVARVAVGHLQAVDAVGEHLVARAERVRLDDEHAAAVAAEERRMIHPARIGVGAQPRLVHAVDQVIAVVLGEAQLQAEEDIHPQRLAGAPGRPIPGEVARHAGLPVVLTVQPGQVPVVQVVRDAQPRIAQRVVGSDRVRRRHMPAGAGLLGVYVDVVAVIHPLPPCPPPQPMARQELRSTSCGMRILCE